MCIPYWEVVILGILGTSVWPFIVGIVNKFSSVKTDYSEH